MLADFFLGIPGTMPIPKLGLFPVVEPVVETPELPPEVLEVVTPAAAVLILSANHSTHY
jgi:hypothetical protein